MKKYYKIMIGAAMILLSFLLKFFNSMLSANLYCENNPHCGEFLPLWLSKLILPIFILGTICLIWEIIEIVKKRK